MSEPLRVAFLGCGFITRVHSGHLRALGGDVVASYASRDRDKASEYCRRFRGAASYGDYLEAIADPRVEAVVIAVPPRFHLDLALRALRAGKHVLVEKPAFLRMADYRAVREARDQAGRIVLVGENDHYKPLAVRLRRLLAERAIGELVFAHFVTIARRLKTEDDWRNDEAMAGGDAFFEEGIHWLHIAGSLGPKIVEVRGLPAVGLARGAGPAGEEHDGGVPLRQRRGRIAVLLARDSVAVPRPAVVQAVRAQRGDHVRIERPVRVRARCKAGRGVIVPGFRDIRGYQAMYRDFVRSVRTGRQPEMSLERAMEDQKLMEDVYAEAGQLA